MVKVTVVDTRRDKNFGIEITKVSAASWSDLHVFPLAIVKHEKAVPCKFFVQCQDRDYIFLESWQDDPELVLEFAIYLEAVLPT